MDGLVTEPRGLQGGACFPSTSTWKAGGEVPNHWSVRRLLGGGEIFFPILENDAVRVVLDALVDKVEDVGLRPAVQLSLDFLRVGVLCQLLPRFVDKEEESVLLRVPHLKLLGTELTHVLGGDVRSHQERLSRAATVDLLEGNSEVILQVERERWGAG